MTNGNEAYKKGARAEYYVMDRLKKKGYNVIRSAGSHTPVDLMAGRGRKCLGIQVKKKRIKTGKRPLTGNEQRTLINFCQKFGAEPMMAYQDIQGFWLIEHVIKGGRRPL